MSNKLVICSSPNDDDLIGQHHNADWANIGEGDWDDLALKVEQYKEVVLVHNSNSDEDLLELITFGNLNNLETPTYENTFYVNRETARQVKDDQILFFGSSHTAGIGHSSMETVYPAILCNMLGKETLVDAHPGKGNSVTEEKIQTYNLQNTTVVIQFTHRHNIYLNGVKYGFEDYTRSLVDVFTDEVLSSHFIECVKRIVNLLKANNVKFVFFYIGGSRDYELMSILSEYPEYVHLIDWNQDIADLEVDLNHNDGRHSGVKSHTYIANRLAQKLNELY